MRFVVNKNRESIESLQLTTDFEIFQTKVYVFFFYFGNRFFFLVIQTTEFAKMHTQVVKRKMKWQLLKVTAFTCSANYFDFNVK